jgi:hypothetical protein
MRSVDFDRDTNTFACCKRNTVTPCVFDYLSYWSVMQEAFVIHQGEEQLSVTFKTTEEGEVALIGL